MCDMCVHFVQTLRAAVVNVMFLGPYLVVHNLSLS